MEYRQIIGYNNYEISNTGLIRNRKTGRILKPSTINGYLVIQLKNKKEKPKKFKIHRLVAIYFIDTNGKDIANLTVHHKNYKRDDNNVDNLEWLSQEDNFKDSCKNNRRETKGKFLSKLIDLYNKNKFESAEEFYKEILEI